MDTDFLFIVSICLAIVSMILSLSPKKVTIEDSSYICNTVNSCNIANDTTRNINYEHYCDSIYYVNKDYYLDVLVESDEFQNYIEKHRE